MTPHKAHGLGEVEFARLKEKLGREPDEIEMGIMGAMWSEHCSYKSSKIHLKRMPTSGERVVQGPGENAGVLELTEDWWVSFKIESHNHPSFIEPFNGAATGVGGIIRDILAMGARPIALLDSLRFGDPSHPKTRYLAHGVVSGIGFYGNCVGIPTVGGELQFHRSYNRNCLVNAFCLGVLRRGELVRGIAEGRGNPLVYAGAKTGRDGIHGATMASAAFGAEDEQAKRPNVQIADPFVEKLLIEACLEAIEKGLVVGMQDMGAAGLINSTSEMAARAGGGIDLFLDRVPLREPGMKPYEIVLSESQERMVIVVPAGREAQSVALFKKWGLDTAVVGQVADHGDMRLLWQGKAVGAIPVQLIVSGAPMFERPVANGSPPPAEGPGAGADDVPRLAEELLRSPNLKSKRWIWEQYDWSVGTNTVIGPGADAALLRLKGTAGGIAMTVDANPRWCHADPRRGAALTLLESFRNLACVGARAIGWTNCLNFGNPENPAVMGQFARTIDGLKEAGKTLRLPVVSGNVSFYNETDGEQIYPTPALALVGWRERLGKPVGASFRQAGDFVVLLGERIPGADGLSGSEAGAFVFGREGIPAYKPDYAAEERLALLVERVVQDELVASAHDVSDGGLFMTLAEGCLPSEGSGLGARVRLPDESEPAAELFGEGPPRYLLTVPAQSERAFRAWADKFEVPARSIGTVGGEALEVEGLLRVPLEGLKRRLESPWD